MPSILILKNVLGAATAKSERTGGERDFRVTLPARLEVRNLTAGYGGRPVLDRHLKPGARMCQAWWVL